MKASPTVIYNIGMGGMVNRPMGWADVQRYGCEIFVWMRGRERDEGAGGMHIHNSFAGVSFTRLRLMEMSLC